MREYVILSNSLIFIHDCAWILSSISSGIKDLGSVVKVFHEEELAVRWEFIGRTLQLPINEISAQYGPHPKSCLLHMIATWLRQGDPPPCWKDVVLMIADKSGGDIFLGASRVAEKYTGM